jgi:hypothetical protein
MDKTAGGLSNQQKGGILESFYAYSIPLFLYGKPNLLFFYFFLCFSVSFFLLMKQTVLIFRFIDVKRRAEHE